MWWPEAEAWREFEELVERTYSFGQSLDWFEKQLRAVAGRHGWGVALPVEDRRRFRGFARGIYRRHGSVKYGRHRLGQLRGGTFKLWVYWAHDPLSACAEKHMPFDGIALPPDHLFWRLYFPPCDSECSCHVSGCRSEADVRRLGGNPDKHLPEGWMSHLPEPAWRGTNWPDLRGIFAEALRDIAE
jgi:hypothetical protein